MSRAHWFALASLPGVGAATARKLLERFPDVTTLFAASPDELAGVPRLTPELAEQLLATPLDALEAELLSLADDGIELLTWDDERFPPQLRGLPDPPLVLFARGTLQPADERAVALVGTRAPGSATERLATTLGRGLAARGLTVVSGLAPGIDAAAHRGALAAPRGRTLAVLGSGLGAIHPREHAGLAEQIAARGALLSELHPNTRPRGRHLMARDRIVSGLSRAVVVVEAGQQSGSLDTATRAERQGRLVYAVGGSPGTEQLLAAGARRVDPEQPDCDLLADEITAYIPSGPREQPPLQPTLL